MSVTKEPSLVEDWDVPSNIEICCIIIRCLIAKKVLYCIVLNFTLYNICYIAYTKQHLLNLSTADLIIHHVILVLQKNWLYSY